MADAGEFSVEARVGTVWENCMASGPCLRVMHSLNLDHARLVVLARLFPTPDKFLIAVNNLAGEEAAAAMGNMDVYLVFDFVKVEVVLPTVHSPPATPMAGVRSAADEGDGQALAARPGASPGATSAVSNVSVAEQRENIEGTCHLIRNANLLGVTTLTVLGAHAADDDEAKAIINKAIAKRSGDGGAVIKAIRGGEDKFNEHVEELCQMLADLPEPMMFAVARIRVCLNQAPPWKAGGKEYWEKYLMRHAYVFPVRFDQLLQQNAHNKALASLVKNLGDLNRIDGAVSQLDHIEAQLAMMSEAGDACMGVGLSFRGRCNKCLEEGHVVKDCPHSAETALKLRAAFCNGHKMAAKKN
jgi:hypothetical protein